MATQGKNGPHEVEMAKGGENVPCEVKMPHIQVKMPHTRWKFPVQDGNGHTR